MTPDTVVDLAARALAEALEGFEQVGAIVIVAHGLVEHPAPHLGVHVRIALPPEVAVSALPVIMRQTIDQLEAMLHAVGL